MPNRLTSKDFVSKSIATHGDKYDYSLVDYTYSRTPVSIICPIHGVFKQRPVSHIWGDGCPKCGFETRKEKTRLTFDEFLSKAKSVHGDRYDYSKSDYINSATKLTITCPIHGDFEQKPNSHLMGKGCIFCGLMSTHESNIEHGFAKHTLYSTWYQMVRRCNDPLFSGYKTYGGRGICVENYLMDVRNFIEYVELLPRYEQRNELKLSLDRMNNDGNYERGNLRWATQAQQNDNRRKWRNTDYKGIQKMGDKFKAGIFINLGDFNTLQEALEARNNYITEHNLPNKIQEYTPDFPYLQKIC